MNFHIQNITGHNKIILYFLLAVVVPCIVLGILAFRGIQNDQALIEKEQKRNADDRAFDIKTFVQDWQNDLFNGLLEIQDLNLDGYPLFFHDSLIQQFVDANKGLETVFYYKGKDLKFLNSSLLFLPDDYPIQESFDFDLKIVDLDLAWRYEYQEQNFKKAVNVYQQAISKNPSRTETAFILNALARIEKKRENLQTAADYYKKIVDDYPDLQLQGKIPIGLIAQLEITKILMAISKPDEAYSTMTDLISSLSGSEWILSNTSYQFINDQLDQILKTISIQSGHQKSNNNIDSLRALSEYFSQKTNEILNLRAEILDLLQESDIQKNFNIFQKEVQEIRTDRLIAEVLSDEGNVTWGIVLNKELFLQNVLIPFLENHNDKDSWDWDIQDKTGKLLVNKRAIYEENPIEYTISSNLSDYKILAFAKPKTLLTTFLGNDQGLYFFIFLFIGALLITGILLMIYMVNRELQLNQMKSDFIATVSHEFKSPITAIRQMAEMFQSNRVPDERKQKYYSVMMQEGERLAHLVDNILDMARIEQGKKRYDFKSQNIQETIRQTVAKYQDRYTGKGLSFNVYQNENIPEVTMDEESIQQVLHNLLDNAIKYSSGSKEIDLSAVQQNGAVAITVKDYGIGIEKEDQLKIFDRFYRVKSDETSGIKGSGLGLTLVKKIIEAHGGKTEIKSKPSKGTAFTFYLPIHKNGKP